MFFMKIKYKIKDTHLWESSQGNIDPKQNFVGALKDFCKQYFVLKLFLKFSFLMKKTTV